MIGFGIAGMIIAFIVFAELYSIRQILSHQQSRTEYIQSLENQLRSLKYDLREHNNALKDIIIIIEDKRDRLSENEKEIFNHSKHVASQQIIA